MEMKAVISAAIGSAMNGVRGCVVGAWWVRGGRKPGKVVPCLDFAR